MARIYAPRQLMNADGSGSGLWHMTVGSDEESWIYAIGYCAENCPGHPSPKEAVEHYHDWEAEQYRYYETSDELRRCAVCKEFTSGRVTGTGYSFLQYVLCSDHATPMHIRQLLREGRHGD